MYNLFKILVIPKLSVNSNFECWPGESWQHQDFIQSFLCTHLYHKTRHDAFSVHHEWEDVIQPVKRITCAHYKRNEPLGRVGFIMCTCTPWQDLSPDSLQRIFPSSTDCTNPALYIDIIIFPLSQFYKPQLDTLGQSTCKMT